MIQAVVFDFDGIIADTEELHFASYQDVLLSRGYTMTFEEYSSNYMMFDAYGCLKQWAADHGLHLEDAELRSWVTEKNSAYEALATSTEIPPLPGALEAIALAASHGPVAVCTGAVHQDIDPLLVQFNLLRHLSAVVTADDVSVSKPDPESYALACSRLGKPPVQCLAIEDTPGGLCSAKGAGCRTLGIATTHTEAQLAPYADHTRPSLVGWTYPESSSRCYPQA